MQSKLEFEDNQVTKIRGEVQRVVFKNDVTGYHVLNVQLPKGGKSSPNNNKGGLITVKLTRPNTVAGMTLEFEGSYVQDPKYGYQFHAKNAREVMPDTNEGLIAYLSSSFFHGIGPVKAHKIVKRFGDETLNIFNTQIDRLLEVAGITKDNLASIKLGWEKNKEINEIMQFLMEYGMSAIFAQRVYEYYGRNCVRQIKENPYDLARHIHGIGFKKADALALSIGFAEDSSLRLKACIEFVLEASEQEGHCFRYHYQIIADAEEYLGFELAKAHVVSLALDELEANGDIVVMRSSVDNDRYYGARIHMNEQYCLKKMLTLAGTQHDIDIDEAALYNHIKRNVGIELSEQQKQAVVGMLRSGVSVLTGLPGTGKTSATKALVEALRLLGISFTLCAPTGRASKRMQEVIDHPAQTIHRLLVWDKPNNGFAHNESNPLNTQCVLVDEFSMVDIHLAAALLRAIPEGAMVMFIGDPDQLPPVGPGNFFRDLIDSNVINVFRLTEIFRQGAESSIVQFSHAINHGEVPNIENPLSEPSLWADKRTDCFFIDSGFRDDSTPRHDHPAWSSLRYGKDVADMIEELYKNVIPKYHDHPDDIQVLIPIKLGPIGIREINRRLQASLNPLQEGQKETYAGDRLLREKDKVTQLVNNYELNVFNGDVGRIVSIDHTNGIVHICYDKDRVLAYNKLHLLDVDLAYAITIHRSQGSEFDFVIMPIMRQYHRMLYRQLVYTGLTRAKKLAVFIGQREALKMAVDTLDSMKRQTSLRELLTGELKPIAAEAYK